ncbi:BAG family molecular chaperone regulator like [Actinidia chinensis var. chinensis]|uniref:BAG family molecular chaperone regulator like n=1 Tax=Actinidia chinensis var. chinensis TaxID=1590841 RepID=A0A2R6QZ61_ACTCC|nr:BAG family molecular chaperone regulator like [Actinidia chinensis var. chinensis]
MKGLNNLIQRGLVVENGHNNEEIEWEVRPSGMLVQKRDDDGEDHFHGVGGPTINIRVVHGSNQMDLVVPSQSTFGDLKRRIAQETSLEPNQQRLLFRGKEKDDQEYLHMVGVKDNAKVLLMEEPTSRERKLEDVKSSELSNACPAVAEVRSEVEKLAEEVSTLESTSEEKKLEEVNNGKLPRACVAVAEVRGEVDKLAEKVAALEAVVYGGTKAEEKEFIILTELLMRQLLKLDSIEAEGEGKVQRKLEVRHVQSLVDTVDSLKARNSNPLGNSSKTVSVTTKWETFDSGLGSLSAPQPPPPSTEVTQDWEQFD